VADQVSAKYFVHQELILGEEPVPTKCHNRGKGMHAGFLVLVRVDICLIQDIEQTYSKRLMNMGLAFWQPCSLPA